MSLAPDIVAGVSRRLAEHAGLELPAWVVEARAAVRINLLGVAPSAYVELIASGRGASELAALVEAVRVGESSLFRHRPQLAAIADEIAPALRGRKGIKVWSAGCAGGEEPFTLAVVLTRALPSAAVSVVATDVSAEALASARGANYPLEALEDVPEEWRDAFEVDGDRIHVRPDIAATVSFERANLLDAIPPKLCDIVMCRNVLIYFSVDARKKAIDRLISALRPGGYLFVGYSETLRDIPELDARRHGDTVFYVKRERETTNPGIANPLDGLRTPPYGTQLTPAAPVKRVSMVRTAVAVPWSVEDSADPRDRTVISASPPPPPTKKAEHVLSLVGQPRASAVIALIGERLAMPGAERVVIDLDPVEMLDDDLAPVLRRARAAANTAGVILELRATKPGPKRWLSRHGLGGLE
ncbi:hypothetical protein BH11MYX2_BH11MYX2_38930 [soil metagenome]